ncbi:MAG: DMT family transporter [Dehalococcoidia bacterium]|nr:DMT family transporter [Dehalococcoidia bacterium]MDW8119679.1 DMT family transporter [Chloroflexota bacterium]
MASSDVAPLGPGQRARVLGQLGLVVVLWASTFPVSKVALAETTPLLLAGLRYAVSGLFLGLWWHLRATPRRVGNKVPWGSVVAFTLTGVVAFNAFFYLGLRQSTAVNGSLIQPVVAAIMTALLGWIILGERMASWRYAAFPLATAGVVLVIVGAPARMLDLSTLVGNLLFVLAGSSFALSNIVGRHLFQRVATLPAVVLATTLGAVVLLLLAGVEGGWGRLDEVSWRVWAIVLYMGVGATGLGYLWWYRGVESIGATRTGVFIFLVPVVGALLSVLFLGETLHPVQVVGGVLALVGVALVLL